MIGCVVDGSRSNCNCEEESRALSDFALDFNVTAHRLNNSLANRKPQSRTTCTPSINSDSLMKRLEKTVAGLGWYANSSVQNLEKHSGIPPRSRLSAKQ